MSDLAVRTSEVADRIGDVLDTLTDTEASVEDRAAAYAVLYALQRQVNRALGIRQKGATPQHELTEHMVRNDVKEIGPLYLAWGAFDVKYPCNGAEQWTDELIQSGMRALRDDPTTRDFIREVPAHLEIDVAALGQAVHDGSQRAIEVYRELKDRKWRTEGGKRPVLKVREAKAPKPKEGSAA